MIFDFGLQSSLLLIGFIQGVVFAGLAWWRGWEEERLSDRLLAVLLLLLSLHIAQYMLGFAGWYDSHDHLTVFMFYFPFHNYLLIPPVVWFYFRSLTNTNFRITGKDWWHFLPGAFYVLNYLLSFGYEIVFFKIGLGQELPIFYGTKGYWGQFSQDLFTDLVMVLGLISTYVYLFLTYRDFGRYKTYVKENFSQADQLQFEWLRRMLIAVLIGLTINWIIVAVDALVVDMTYRQFWFSHLGVAILIYFLSILGYSAHPSVRTSLQFDPSEPPSTDSSTAGTLDADQELLKVKLVQIIESKAPYLDPELTLAKLAGQLSAPPSQLSKVINTGFGKNFNDFINEQRVRAVKEKLMAGAAETHTLLSIALDCGFNSKATFNRAFRKFTGESPRHFLDNRKER